MTNHYDVLDENGISVWQVLTLFSIVFQWTQEFERWNVTDVVRCCEPTYAKEPLEGKGIKVHDWVYGDGEAPPNHIVDAWLGLIEKRFGGEIGNHDSNEKGSTKDGQKPPCIATHCVAGLGRCVYQKFYFVSFSNYERSSKPNGY